MSLKSKLIATCAASAMLLSAVAAQAGQGMSFDSLPAPVRQSVEVLAPDVGANEFSAEKEKGGVYAIGYSKNGTHLEITVNANGEVVRIEEKLSYKPVPSSAHNDRIADAASINEDMVEFALAGEAGKVEEKIAALKQALPGLRTIIGETAYEKVGGQLQAMETHSAKGDMTGVSMAAVEAYKQLELTLDKAALVVPIEVSMLDYSGFKLNALSHAKSPEWADIAASAKEAAGYWKALEGNVADKGLRDLMNSIQLGLDEGVARKDAAQVGFAAQLKLDAVDLLEHYFVSAYKTSAGAVAPDKDEISK